MTTEIVEATEAENAAAEQAAANAAFGQTRGVEPPAVQGPKPEPVIEAPVKTEAEVQADTKAADEAREKEAAEAWLKGAPKSVQESLSAMSGMTSRLRNIEGHIGGLTSQQKELKAALTAAKTAAVDAGAEAPTDAQVAAATTSAKWNQMKEDFPEWADAMEERLLSVKGGGPVDVDGITKKVTESFTPQLADVEMRARQFARVDMAHEDWEETVKTPEFSTWLQAQPEEVKALAGSVYAKDAIKLLNSYSEHSKPKPTPAPPTPASTAKDRLEAAITPTSGRSVGARSEMTEQQAADAAFRRVRTGA